ncbi:MAG TPA: hypothetical protein VMM15_23605 [Bradyrhizobium sp.]|nr:hypothetical protein [Bradyrhizobium sp.]
MVCARRVPRSPLTPTALHREPDDGDVRLDRSKDGDALHRQAKREKLGMDKIIAFDQSFDDLMPLPDANSARTRDANKVVTLRSNSGKKTLWIQ